MFGDPVTNPMGWPIVALGNLVAEFRYGTSTKSGPTGLPVLRIPNVIGGRLDLGELKLVALPSQEEKRLVLQQDDLLFVRTNGNPDYVGRCAVFSPGDILDAGMDARRVVYASYLIRARLKSSISRATYLQSALSSGAGRKRLRERARTSAGQFNINIDGLSSIQVALPPLDLQIKFERLVEAVGVVLKRQTEADGGATAIAGTLLG
jgi:type I restriction enzyme S subunit